ncbi:hypothetical protein ACFQU9_29955 [Actinomadura namibiensis]|uniref:hypothetical protein n=1 Tax=Actinomadura kijaniata TaxID=46161 RepID=UPI0036083FC1
MQGTGRSSRRWARRPGESGGVVRRQDAASTGSRVPCPGPSPASVLDGLEVTLDVHHALTGRAAVSPA